MTNPVLVEVVRGGEIESRHRGAVAVCDADGQILSAVGAIEAAIFPRSAVKPLQALALIESGAAEACGLDDRAIALACASHSGEPEHVALVADWLARLGLGPEALECGAHPPLNAAAAEALVREGRAPCPLHHNCSGKHAGFLTQAVHGGLDPRGYVGHAHPVQRRVAAVLGAMTGVDMGAAPWGVDGCGIPTYALPLRAVALGMARLAQPAGLGEARAAACARVRAAMAAHPFLVAGSGRACTAIMQAVPGVLVKGGAEGVYTALLPQHGVGVAIKIDDGAGRAAEVVVAAVLDRLGAFTDDQRRRLADRLRPPVRTMAGAVAGVIRAVGLDL